VLHEPGELAHERLKAHQSLLAHVIVSAQHDDDCVDDLAQGATAQGRSVIHVGTS